MPKRKIRHSKPKNRKTQHMVHKKALKHTIKMRRVQIKHRKLSHHPVHVVRKTEVKRSKKKTLRKTTYRKPKRLFKIKKPIVKKPAAQEVIKQKEFLGGILSRFKKKEELIPTTAVELTKKIETAEEETLKPEEKHEFPKEKLVIFPKENVGIKYSLIEPFAYADIKWDDKGKEFVYNLREPTLTEEEKKIYEKIVGGLMEILDIELSAVKKKDEALNYLEEQTKKVLDEYEIKLPNDSFIKILYFIQRNFVGLNEIEPLMQDPYIEDISCDGVGIPLYIIHRRYGSIKTNIAFDDLKKLREFVVKLAERSGRFISYAEPLLDGTLTDGSRVQATFASDVTTRGPSVTIRKFVQEPFSPIDLLNKKTVSSDMLSYLWLAIENGASTLIAGGVGTGKTTLLNALLMFVPNEAKIVSIEDTRELNLPHENWVPAVTRVGFAKGYGEVTMFDLLKEAFRQTPNYVIVGEVRGTEAYVMFQGMASGIPAMGTMHAGRVEDVIYRLQTPPISLSPALIDTLDLVLIMIHTREKGEAARRMKEVVEIESVDQTSGKARTNQVYRWSANEDTYEYNGTSYFLQEIAAHKGVEVTELMKELERRRKILEWMQKSNTVNYRDVVSILTEYRKSPGKVLKDAGIKD